MLGSFANLLIYRLPRNEEIVFKRSHCPHCNHALGVLDLIPIVSYLIQLGKCRYCAKKIPIRYLVCEIASTAIFVVCWKIYGNSWLFYKTSLFLFALLILFFTDFEHFVLPNVITFPLIGVGLVASVFEDRLIDALWGTAIGFGAYFIIGVVGKWHYKKEAMGGGDSKLGAGIGAFWGIKIAALTCYLSFMIAGIPALILILLKLRKRTDHVPFGPAIITACVFSLIFGQTIWNYFAGR